MRRPTYLSWKVLTGGLLTALILGTGVWAGAKGEKGDDSEKTITFSKKELGKVPKGWKVAKTGQGEGSDWAVVTDNTSPSKSGYVLAQTAESPRSVFNLCVINKSKYRDVEIEVKFKSVKGKVDRGGGPVWRYQDADDYYVARFNPLEDNYRLYKVVGGKRTQLATKEGIKVPAGEWHSLGIEHVGNQIECELDGKVILAVTDNSIKRAGKVGLWTKADAQTCFDQFTIEEEANGTEDHDGGED